jgi:transposase-like protein
MSEKKRKRYSREFKMEAVRLITEKGYSMGPRPRETLGSNTVSSGAGRSNSQRTPKTPFLAKVI